MHCTVGDFGSLLYCMGGSDPWKSRNRCLKEVCHGNQDVSVVQNPDSPVRSGQIVGPLIGMHVSVIRLRESAATGFGSHSIKAEYFHGASIEKSISFLFTNITYINLNACFPSATCLKVRIQLCNPRCENLREGYKTAGPRQAV